ncbi:hypothetical protein ACGF5C_13575 [Micromonospora sp. NPDC047620]|uniref:hypothetical protein n=1 Tax=Micromonospora sp. NPDC047620 TaxID=3364251 RepID=UPI003721B17B
MSYQDWGRGDDGPRERPPAVAWDGPPDPSPADPYDGDTARPRARSRRRGVAAGQQEFVDPYLPRWALESGVRRADGGGRHAAPDDEDDLDRPQERGYSGRRRAEDDPASGATPQGRPKRLPPSRPPVVRAGPGEPADASGPAPTWEDGRPDRRGRRVAEDRPAVEPWDREARGSTPSYPPPVDPWDASGVRAWRPAGEVDRWEHSAAAVRWDRSDDTGQWHQPDSTGQWERYSDGGGWDRTVPPRPGGGTAEGWPWPGQDDRDEGSWSGTRLAGDDPRWMDPPASAPPSPVASYIAPRPRMAPRRRASEPVAPSRASTSSAVRGRVEAAGAGAWSRHVEDDLLDADPGGPWRPLLYTAACYLVPAVLIFVWLLTLDGQAPAGCVTDISGGGCDSPRSRALGSLSSGLPRFGLALASSLVVALLLRRVDTTWRSATVALAAAVVGGGLSTVMISAVTGQPIG